MADATLRGMSDAWGGCSNSAGGPMRFAWFWGVLVRIMQVVLCHLHRSLSLSK